MMVGEYVCPDQAGPYIRPYIRARPAYENSCDSQLVMGVGEPSIDRFTRAGYSAITKYLFRKQMAPKHI